MVSQRSLLGFVIAVAAAGSADAQNTGTLRWRAGGNPLGLQAGAEPRLPCASFAFSCTDTTTVPLYSSVRSPRTLSMQVGNNEAGTLRLDRPQGLNVSVIGKAGIASDLGVYGRVGTTFNRAPQTLPGLAPTDGGLTYGVGLSWDFSRSASAAVGLDTYDVRGAGSEVRSSIGLQWRY